MAVSAKRNARIELTAGTAGMDRGLDDARRKMRTFERDQAKADKAAERAAARRAKAQEKARAKAYAGIRSGITHGVGMALGAAGLNDIADMGRQVLDFERNLTRFQVVGEMSTDEINSFRAAILKTSDATGVSKEQLLEGAAAYVGFTGDAKGATEQLDLLARTTRATGASASDIAGIFATFNKNLHLDPSQWSAAMDILVKQAHEGGVELNDLAGKFAPVAAAYAQFAGGASVKGLANASAMAQVFQNLTHDTSETATHVQRMFDALEHNANKLRSHGIDPYTTVNGRKVGRDPLEVLDEIHSKGLDRDAELMQKLFPEERARKTARYLLDNLDTVHRIAEESANSNQVAKDYSVVVESSAGKMDAAWNRVKNSVAEAMTPDRIRAFSDALVKAIGLAADLVGYIAKIAKFIEDHTPDVDKSAASVTGDKAQAAKDIAFAGTAASGERSGAMDILGGLIFGASGAENVLKATGTDEAAVKAVTSLAGGSTGDLFDNELITGKFQKAVAAKLDPWDYGATSGSVRQVSPEEMKRAIVDGVREGISSLGIKIGAEPIQQAGANSINHRKGR